MTIRLLHGDCRDVLKTLLDCSVHCCITSPPYWGLRSYLPTEHPDKHKEIGSEPTLQEWVDTMVAVFREVRRVLRDDGTCWVNLGDAYAGSGRGGNTGTSTMHSPQPDHAKRTADVVSASRRENCPAVAVRGSPSLKNKDLMGQPWRVAFALQADGWWLRQEIIWAKKNPMPESLRDRFTKAHEHVFLLSKQERYYFDSDAVQEPSSLSTHARLSQDVEKQTGSFRAHAGNGRNGRPMKAMEGRTKNNANFDEAITVTPVTRNPRSVRHLASEPFKGAHFATYPPALIEPFVLAGCPRGGVVLDPFAGSGTTGLVADRNHRNAILIDLDERCMPMATDRISGESPLFSQMETAPWT